MTAPPHRLYEQPWPAGEHRHVQLGFVVDDVIASARRWAAVHGVGPFHVLPRRRTPCLHRGVERVTDAQIAVAQAGPVQIELIAQFDDGPSIYRDLAGRGACRFHQLSTVTADFERARSHYVAMGYPPACELEARGQRVSYFDTLDDFGFFTEVVEDVPGFIDSVAAIAATCAAWDGADPVRILTRDGYRTP